MPRLSCVSVACAFIACVSGCAAPAAPFTAITAPAAREIIIIGKSTKSDVLAALGKTTAIRFDSGYEVWVYQIADDVALISSWRKAGPTEFVILFAPSGVVAKTRTRPLPPPRTT
jgi:hypothetical protein